MTKHDLHRTQRQPPQRPPRRGALTLYVVVPIAVAAALAAITVVVLRGGGDDEPSERDRSAAELDAIAREARAILEQPPLDPAFVLPPRLAPEPEPEPVPEAIDDATDDATDDAPDDVATARAEALEQARQAGILGQAALGQGGAFASLTGSADFSSGLDDADYGTLGGGTGGGLGSGRGGLGSTHRGNIPQVRIGQPQQQGDLDKAIIRRYIKRSIAKITYCYEKQLVANPDLAGTVRTQFTIAPDGTVSGASASGVDEDVADCIAGVIEGIVFAKPKGGGSVQVQYPFTFRPAGG